MSVKEFPSSAAGAMAWEIWQAHRRGFLWVIGALPVCAGLYQAFLAKLQSSDALQALSFFPMAASLLATFVFFNYTESDRKGRFAGFPSRLFTLPLSTWVIVTCPIVFGAGAIVLLYLAWAKCIYAPAGIQLPVDWPSLYLAAGMICYQTLIWSLARFRVLRLVALGVCGTLLATGWLVFRRDMAESFAAVLFPGNLHPPIKSLLLLVLGALSLCGYVGALVAVSRQRHGSGATAVDWSSVWHRLVDALPGLNRPFASASAAQFWFEWRRHGFLLPLAVAFVLALMMGPTLFMDQVSSEATVLIVSWTFVAPLLLSLTIGKGFCRTDLWSREQSVSPFLAMRPLTCGEWVGIKLKTAALSASVAWLMALVSATLWVIHRGDLEPIARGWDTFCHLYSAPRRSLILILFPLCGMALTWRFLVASLYSGMSSRASLGTLSLASTFVFCFGGLMTAIWFDNHPGQIHRLAQFVDRMPAILGLLLSLKAWFAFRGWQKAYEQNLVTSRFVVGWVGCWVGGVALFAALIWLLIPEITWINRLCLLGAMALMPLARVAQSPRVLAGNRHRGERTQYFAAGLLDRWRGAGARAETGPPAMNRRFNILLALFACGVAGIGLLLASQSTAALPRWFDAGGHRLRMSILGHGSPAVVFEQFGPAPLEDWTKIQRGVARETCAIAYSHGGYGGSEPGPKPRDAHRVASELHAALRSAGIPPPYLFVGHSFGGPYSRVFAGLYPDEVAGLILLDPSQESFFDWLREWSPEMNQISSEARAAQSELGRALESLEQARASILPSVPVTVVTGMRADEGELDRKRLLPLWLKSHRTWVQGLPQGRHLVTRRSGHGIPHDEPDFVLETIRDLVREVR